MTGQGWLSQPPAPTPEGDMDDIKGDIEIRSTDDRAKDALLRAIEDLKALVNEGQITTLVALGIKDNQLVLGSTAGVWYPTTILGAMEQYKHSVLVGEPDIYGVWSEPAEENDE